MEEVRAALLRPEEAADEADEEPVRMVVKAPGVSRGLVWLARIAGSGMLLWLWRLALLWWSASERGPLLDGILFALFTLVPVVLVRGLLGKLLRPGKAGRWSRLWWKILEKKLLWMAGARGKESRGAVASEPTEVALGAGANQLFERLPREMQTRFADLPNVLDRLEGQARRLRGSPADLSGERLATTLSAMEQLRLDLLRLQAGAAREGDLTADLEAARQVSQRVDNLLQAFREVEAGLRTPTPVT